MTENSKPYKLVLCKEKVKHLKSELNQTKVKCDKVRIEPATSFPLSLESTLFAKKREGPR